MTSDRTADTLYADPLQEGQIRVLALQPGSGGDPLECQIRLVDALRGDFLYEAISYVWGRHDAAGVIRINPDSGGGRQVDLPLTRNAADALRAVRVAQDVRWIWIDAICISQTSKAEKAAQVAIMDVIFANATAVLIWLGGDDGVRSAAAAEIATLIQEHFNHNAGFPKEPSADMELVESRPTQRCYDELSSVLPLFECEWFWRLWCVQEVVLAKQSLVYWGSIILTWDTIAIVASFIESEAQLRVAHFGLAGVYNVIMLESFRKQVTKEDGERMPFSRMLGLTRLHGVTEPCDRIYSLLGLDRRLNGSSKQKDQSRVHRWFMHCSEDVSGPLVSPDYLQGINKVYLTTAKALLAREGNLHLLSFVQHDGEVEAGDLPTWVPRWHVNKQRLITQFDLIAGNPVLTFLDTVWAEAKSTADTSHTKDRFSAACNITSWFSISTGDDNRAINDEQITVDDNGTLHAEGLLLANVVDSCLSVPCESASPDQWLETLRQWFRIASTWLPQNNQSNLVGLSAGQREKAAFRMFYMALLGGHFRVKEVFMGLQAEVNAFRALLCSSLSDETNACPVTRAFVSQMCRSRTLFLTDGGQIGLGPDCLQVGDSVCFLAGAAVPLLLRPRATPDMMPRRWLLVGETYVNWLAGTSPRGDVARGFDVLLYALEGEARWSLSAVPEPKAHTTIPHNQRRNLKKFRAEPESGYVSNVAHHSGYYYTNRYIRTPKTFSRPSTPKSTGSVSQTTQGTFGTRIQFCID